MPDLTRAARILHSCWNEGSVVDYAKGEPWPETAEQGYNVQAQLARLRDEPVVGWKIAATALAGRDHIHVDRPLAGRVFESVCHSDGAELPLVHNRMAVAEAEFVFTLGRALPARKERYSEHEVADSIQSLHPGLEIPDSRFRDFTLPGTAGLIADNACAAHFVLGEPTSSEFDLRALGEHETALFINDKEVTTGSGADVLKGPLSAMVWIVNTLCEQGIGLEAGQFVTTGVTGAPSPIKVGDRVRADLGMFGSVAVLVT